MDTNGDGVISKENFIDTMYAVQNAVRDYVEMPAKEALDAAKLIAEGPVE